MRIFAMIALSLCAACGTSSEFDVEGALAAKDKQIEVLERQIERLRRQGISGTSCGVSLSDITYRIQQGENPSKASGYVEGNLIELNKVEDQNPNLHQRHEIFGGLTEMIGKCYQGLPSGGSTERTPDLQEWQWALGGSAILIRHALEDGSYGGDTYIYEDAQTETLVYVYITNAGFRTEGSIELNGDAGFTAEEAVTGHPTITKVRSTSSFRDDGSIHVASELFQDGRWVSGHAFTYTQTDTPPMLKPVSDDTAER